MFEDGSGSSSVLGLEVVLLASPFSTEDFLFSLAVVVQLEIARVLVVVVVVSEEFRLRPDCAWCEVAEPDLNVGVTVADGLVEATALDLLSDRGLIGTEVVEEPRTCGRGAALTTPEADPVPAVDDPEAVIVDDPEGTGGITLTGFTCPTAGGFCCCCGVAEPVGGCCCWLLIERKTEVVGVAAVVHFVVDDELVALLNGKAVDCLEVIALTAEVGAAAAAVAEAAAVVVADLVDCAANAGGAVCGSSSFLLISKTGLNGLTEVAGDWFLELVLTLLIIEEESIEVVLDNIEDIAALFETNGVCMLTCCLVLLGSWDDSDKLKLNCCCCSCADWSTGLIKPGTDDACNSLGVFKFSSLLVSSSNTLLRDSSLWTMGEGWVGLRSKLNLAVEDDDDADVPVPEDADDDPVEEAPADEVVALLREAEELVELQ